MTDRPTTEPRTEADDRMAKVLVDHQRRDAGSCICGWSKWGASHAEHQWRMLKLAGAEAAQGAAPLAEAEALLDRIMDEWDRDEAIAGLAAALAAPRAEGLDVDWGAMRRAGWEPDFNVCASCHHHGSRHDLNNVCLDCGDRFSSMSEDEQWAWAAAEYARLSRPSDERVPESEAGE